MKQKKIGILTFHYGSNYGGVLQSYALQHAIIKMGYSDVSIINCIPKKWYWFLIGIPLNFSYDAFYKAWLKIRYGYCCRKNFDNFRKKYLNCTEFVSEKQLPFIANKYDVIICGSDQIWNPSQHIHRIYFLNWDPGYVGRRIAYAPCCAKNVVLSENKTILQKALLSYDFISVRNIETQHFVRDLISKEVPIVPDPTILIDFEPLIRESTPFNYPYVLTYILGKDINGTNSNAIQKIREAYSGCRIIAVVIANSNPVDCFWADTILYDVSPVEWLNLIYHATLLFTDSFHGVLFSMKLGIPFIAYYVDDLRKSRFIDLGERYNIQDNIVTSISELENLLDLNVYKFKNYENKLEKQRSIGLSFLQKALLD